MDEWTAVDTGWGMVHNDHPEPNAGFTGDPGTSAYEQLRRICHSKGVATGRLSALFFSFDCKPTCMESQTKSKYRDEHSAPLPGAAGDLARSCDEQLLDAFLAIKRILDERALLVDCRDCEREREESAESAYDAPTGGEEESHGNVESAQQASSTSGYEADAQSDGHMTDDEASAPPAAVTGGTDCDQSGDQQGHVLPFGHGSSLICPTEGCNRHRRRYFERGYTTPSLSAGVLAIHCCCDCVRHSHCPSSREVGPQPTQEYYGRAFDPETSLANQRLITPPEQLQTALVPQLEQEEEVGEQFFADQTAVQAPPRSDDSADVFIDDGDDDEPSQATDAGQLSQREGPTMVSATGWCNGDAVRFDGSMAITTAETLGKMPHGRWQSCVASGMPTGIVYIGAQPWTAQVFKRDGGTHLGTWRSSDLRRQSMTARVWSLLKGS